MVSHHQQGALAAKLTFASAAKLIHEADTADNVSHGENQVQEPKQGAVST